MIYETYTVPGSYPDSLPRDKPSQQQKEKIWDVIKDLLWLFELKIVT